MRFLLVIPIKLYWLLIPADKRRTCIYSTSCSRHVYQMTNEKGILFGFKALRHRFKTCRPGHEIIYLDKEDVLLIKLSNGTILQENEIASNIVAIYKSKA